MLGLVRSRPARLLAALVGIGTLAACGGGDGGSGGASLTVTTGAGGGPATVTVEAHDVYFDLGRITVPAGALEVTLVEKGNQAHTLVVEGADDFKLEVSGGTGQDSGTLELAPGEHEFYCDVPGHRGQGMSGTIVAR